MAEQFRFCHTPERVRPYVPEGEEEAVEQFYRENPGVAHLELLERPPSWTSVLPEEEEIRGREAD